MCVYVMSGVHLSLFLPVDDALLVKYLVPIGRGGFGAYHYSHSQTDLTIVPIESGFSV